MSVSIFSGHVGVSIFSKRMYTFFANRSSHNQEDRGLRSIICTPLFGTLLQVSYQYPMRVHIRAKTLVNSERSTDNKPTNQSSKIIFCSKKTNKLRTNNRVKYAICIYLAKKEWINRSKFLKKIIINLNLTE